MVQGQSTSANNDQLLISLKSPYKNLVEISGFNYSVKGETDTLYYQKDFCWSTDGILYNDWQPLDNEHIKKILLNPEKDFWPQYRFTQIGDGELEFESISLETTSIDGLMTEIPMCGVNDNSTCCGQQNLVFECCEGGFNPYALGNSSAIYTQISQVVSNMFGFCVQYFKTSADQRSRDIILHEYSLLNVIQDGNIKIVIPDNQLPTREINFNPLMMDYPTVFEVHIVKAPFRQVFGQDAKPEVGDYLYFEQYMNKMYEISATSETDDYLYSGAYWRVSLSQYQKRSAVKFDTEELEETVDTLVFNTDKFNIESLEQEADVRKPEQYNTVGKLENDYVRRILDKRLKIETENIYNNWTVISKSHYALKSVPERSDVVVYRYDKGWGTSDERMITMWFRPKYNKEKTATINVGELMEYDGKLAIFVGNPAAVIKPGDLVNLNGTDYPKMVRVEYVKDGVLYTNVRFRDNCMYNATLSPYSTATLISSLGGFDMSFTANNIVVSTNGKDIVFELGNKNESVLKTSQWYGIVVMFKPADSKCGLWVYSLSQGSNNLRNMDSELSLVYYKMKEATGLTCPDGAWMLKSGQVDITNIRIWNQLCEESLHNLILSQYVVKDSHLCELVDNAQPELMVDKVTNPR